MATAADSSSSEKKATLPLVYSCSGCSNVAQLANAAALALQARGLAQMSCIAGVGGGVKGLVKLAKSGRPIIALDGCALHCCKACLAQVQLTPDLHLTLTDEGLRKQAYSGTDVTAVDSVVAQVISSLQAQGCASTS